MYKVVKYTLIIVLFFFSFFAYGQNVQKGFDLLKNKEYIDAIQTFNKAIEKNKDVIAAKYGLTIIYADTAYKRYRYSRAYKYLLTIQKKYEKTPENERDILRKEFSIDDISMGRLRLKILNEALHEAMNKSTIEAYEEFCLDFPNTEQSASAILLKNNLAFNIAKNQQNADDLIDFIWKYANTPEADSAKEILHKYEDAAYDFYSSEGELESILKFEKQYPDFKDKARLLKDKELAEMAFKLDLDESFNPNKDGIYLDFIKKAAPGELAFVALIRTLTPYLEDKKWQDAIKRLQDYKSYFPENKRIDSIIAILARPDQTIDVESISDAINTAGHEYSPVITTDGKTIYFCGRSRDGNIGGEDIFVARFEDGKWQKPRILNAINTPFAHEAPLAISADGNRLLLYANTDIYYSEKKLSGWSIPGRFPSINGQESWEADAMTTSDGNAIIFISDRKGNVGRRHPFGALFHGSHSGNSDIYVSIRTESGWSGPINLGKTINTPFSERSPFLHPDMKTLYFSSEGHAGLGRLDVFKSVRLNDTLWTEWSEPVNLGKEINTAEDEYDYRISTDGEYAFLSTFKSNNYDIFKMKLPKEVRPDYVAIVSGTITNKKGEPVQAIIKWENLKTSEVIGFAESDLVDGSYMIILPLGKNFGYFIEHPDYYPLSGNLDLTDKHEQIEIRKDFVLLSYVEIINEKLPIPLENVFFEFNKFQLKPESYSELNRLVKFIKKNAGMKVEIAGHTDDVGSAEYNKKLSDQRAKAVVDYLLRRGIDQSALIATGYGETKPITTNDTDEGKAKNRRVEFRVLEK